MTTSSAQAKALLLDAIASAYNRNGWHGATLRGALRGLTPEVALYRVTPRRHNIWEITAHAAYWKYVVWRRLTRSRRSSFALGGSDWINSPDSVTKADIAGLVRVLDDEHQRMVETIAAFPELPGGRARSMLYGIAAHDVYHTGQVQLLKRLAEDRRRRP